jgi:ADP-heptose:LPS heptosyltransferase
MKEWPTRCWVELGRALSQHGLEIVVTGGPSDRDDSDQLVRACELGGFEPTSLAGRLSLAETAWLLRESAAVVVVNTGVMHLAAIGGASVVALHGPTNPERWGPVGGDVHVVGPAQGGGFLSLGFEFDGHPADTMERLAVASVLEKTLSIVARTIP